jgi:hypothetical protein
MSADSYSSASYRRSIQRVQLDTRLGMSRYALISDADLMQIHPAIRRCVGFLGVNTRDGMKFGGTFFFVQYPIEGTTAIETYVVTTAHSIEDIREFIDNGKSIDGLSWLRLNHRNNGRTDISVPLDSWHRSTRIAIDVAVAVVEPSYRDFDYECVPLSLFMTPESANAFNLGQGDELFFPGLFRYRQGDKSNIPIIRIGNVAAMPEEPITVAWGTLPRAYLVEGRSIGGLSGSPVFWHLGQSRQFVGGVTSKNPPILLLGMVHGHYDEVGNVWDFGSDVTDSTKEKTNSGIAIVIPVEDIRDTLEIPELQKMRADRVKRIQAAMNLGVADTRTPGDNLQS